MPILSTIYSYFVIIYITIICISIIYGLNLSYNIFSRLYNLSSTIYYYTKKVYNYSYAFVIYCFNYTYNKDNEDDNRDLEANLLNNDGNSIIESKLINKQLCESSTNTESQFYNTSLYPYNGGMSQYNYTRNNYIRESLLESTNINNISDSNYLINMADDIIFDKLNISNYDAIIANKTKINHNRKNNDDSEADTIKMSSLLSDSDDTIKTNKTEYFDFIAE